MRISFYWILIWSVFMMGCGGLVYHFFGRANEFENDLPPPENSVSSMEPEIRNHFSDSKDFNLDTELSPSETSIDIADSRELTELEKSQTIRDFLKDVSDPKKRASRRFSLIGLQVFDTNGDITDVFSEVYGLSEDELRDLSESANEVREDYFDLAREHSALSEYEHGSMRVEIEPFEGGEKLYSRLLDSFETVLGADRFSDFMQISEQGIADNFYQFGGEKLDILVTPFMEERKDPDGNPIEMPAYKVSIKKEGFNRNGSSSYSGLSEEDFSERFGIVKRLIEDAEAKP